MKYALPLVILFAVFVGIGYMNHKQDGPIQWCPKGQEAVVVGSGYDVTHTITVLYGCDSPVKVKL